MKHLFQLKLHQSYPIRLKSFIVVGLILSLMACQESAVTQVPKPSPEPTSPPEVRQNIEGNVGELPDELPDETTGDSTDELLEEILDKVLADLTLRTQLPASVFEVISTEAKFWPDGCLGLAQTDELCTQAIVPGWQVVLTDQEEHWIYRTDEFGFAIRLQGE